MRIDLRSYANLERNSKKIYGSKKFKMFEAEMQRTMAYISCT